MMLSTVFLKRISFVFLIFIYISCKENKIEKLIETKKVVYQKGVATWYGPRFHNKLTSKGEIFDMNDFTAAHRKLPFGTIIRVRNIENNRTVIVRINDRGPVNERLIIDLSRTAANYLMFSNKGSAKVEIEILGIGDNPLQKIFSVYKNLGNN